MKKPALKLEGTEVLKVFIDKYPSRKHDFFVASVLDVVGHSTDAGIDVLEVLESMDIVSEFPEAVLKEAEKVPDAPSQQDMEGRLDLRDELTFTIDGAGCQGLGRCSSHQAFEKWQYGTRSSHRGCFLLCD